MNRFLAAIAVMAVSGPVSAQSSGPAQFTGPALSDWEGFYLGAQIETISTSTFTNAASPLVTGEIDGEIFGTFVGYRRQFGSLVVGGEADFVGGDVDTTFSALGFAATDGSDIGIIRAGAEVGYAFGRFLPYATAGYSRIVFRNTANGDNVATGSFVGVGLDYQSGEYGTLGVEMNRHNFGDFSLSPDNSLDATTVGVSFSLRY